MIKLIHRVIIILSFLAFLECSCQNILTGLVLNSPEQEPLIGATIIIRNPQNKTILKYGITDNNGNFRIVLEEATKKFIMEVSYLGYRKWNKFFEQLVTEVKIELEPSSEALDELFLESYAIEQRNDTISYNINQLKKASDLVISDVIKRLPGIEVRPTGEYFIKEGQ